MSTTEIPRGDSGPRYVRLQVELVLEVSGPDELRAAALDHIAADEYMPPQERLHARDAVGNDESEALAYLVDPADLLSAVPGVDLVQASWSCAHTEYDPDSDEWDLDDEDAADGDGDEAEDDGAAADGDAEAEDDAP
ncbi:hypothetical protein [Actinacidiphila alni]|uniref:hypothetical protein n=1 Tax=Actinacidiphila alni TaxID=380248 RepID=UPI003451FC5D